LGNGQEILTGIDIWTDLEGVEEDVEVLEVRAEADRRREVSERVVVQEQLREALELLHVRQQLPPIHGGGYVSELLLLVLLVL